MVVSDAQTKISNVGLWARKAPHIFLIIMWDCVEADDKSGAPPRGFPQSLHRYLLRLPASLDDTRSKIMYV